MPCKCPMAQPQWMERHIFRRVGLLKHRKLFYKLILLVTRPKVFMWHNFEEVSLADAQVLIQRATESDRKFADSKQNCESNPTTTQLQPNDIRQLLIYPCGKGGIPINTEDYLCLATDQYLNDIIIDFYLKGLHDNIIPKTEKHRTFIFKHSKAIKIRFEITVSKTQ
uniref:Uncharacterized protein n=1 Tax=Glossina austeni TaxID=7395 RepID=A0A1A9UN16_GLOAU